MKHSELMRIRNKILKLQYDHTQSAIWEKLCEEEPQFCKEFWGDDFMQSKGDQSPGYFAVTWAEGLKYESYT